MADITHTIQIKHNLVGIFKAVTAYDDVQAMQQWQPSLQAAQVTAGDPLRTGSMIALRKRFFMSDIFINADVVDLQRNKRIALKGIHGRFPFQRTIEFSSDHAATTIQDSISIHTGFLYLLWRPILVQMLRQQTATEWRTLQAHLSSH